MAVSKPVQSDYEVKHEFGDFHVLSVLLPPLTPSPIGVDLEVTEVLEFANPELPKFNLALDLFFVLRKIPPLLFYQTPL